MERMNPNAAAYSVTSNFGSSRYMYGQRDTCISRQSFCLRRAPGEPPDGSKHVKALEWLRRTNKDHAVNPLVVLGKLIENYMEQPIGTWNDGSDAKKIEAILAQCKLRYVTGGRIVAAQMSGAASRTLEALLQSFDYRAIDEEFSRALENVQSEPREAVSAASNN